MTAEKKASASLKIALVQCNFHVGFIEANAAKIRVFYDLAVAGGADLVVFSEMAITGYPPEDLIFCQQFRKLNLEALASLLPLTCNSAGMIIGGLWCEEGGLYNAAFLIENGEIIHRQFKHALPNYGVFDERRYFSAGILPASVEWRGTKLGLMICEDMWHPDVASHLEGQGAQILISINASPYETGKVATREAIAFARNRETELPLIYLNQIGGQDNLVFDGGSFVISPDGTICLRMKICQEDIQISEWQKKGSKWTPLPRIVVPRLEGTASDYHAMVLALRDFVAKNGFSGVVLGISGGIDSAVSAAVAADAVGADNVHLVMLPSEVTSRESMEDAKESAKLLGTRFDVIPIDKGIHAFREMMASISGEHFEVLAANNHTRLRASILLAISAQERSLLLTTGNKSELATGYTTIYGDMCGYFSVLRDVYKTTVYKLARWRNAQSYAIPEHSISRAPTGETMFGQFDQDILPPYDLLDKILDRIVDRHLSVEEIIAEGFDAETVVDVRNRVFGAEYKRWQSSPGVKLTAMSFNHDRRYPLTSMWRAERTNFMNGLVPKGI